MLLLLDDDALASVLQHCRTDGTRMWPLIDVAASNRRLCNVTRSQLAYSITLTNARLRQLPAMCAAPVTPFTGCTSLVLELSSVLHVGCKPQAIAAALAAPGRWLGLRKLQLSSTTSFLGMKFDVIDQCLVDIISSMSSLQQLQELVMQPALGPRSLVRLGTVTQLTSLQLGPSYGDIEYTDLAHLRVLPCLTKLKHLLLHRRTSAACSGLPTSLEALECQMEGDEVAERMRQLKACPGLQTLEVRHHFTQVQVTDTPSSSSTSTATPSVLDLAAQHTPGLKHLTVDGHFCSGSMGPPYEWQHEWQSADIRRAGPLRRMQPSAAAEQLTQLQRLRVVGSSRLDITTPAEWCHFGRLASLQSVTGVYIQCRPPKDLQLPHLQQLCGSVCLSGADTGLLLGACPALKEASLEVKPQPEQESSSRWPQATAAAAAAAAATPVSERHGSLTEVELSYKQASAPAAAAHFAAAAPVLVGMHSLALTWPHSSSRSSSMAYLPRLAALTALTQLSLEGVGEGGCALEEDLLLALQPLQATLKDLSLKGFSLVTPRVVLVLQGLLPALQRVKVSGCGPLVPARVKEMGRAEGEQLGLLQQLLRPNLTLDTYVEHE